MGEQLDIGIPWNTLNCVSKPFPKNANSARKKTKKTVNRQRFVACRPWPSWLLCVLNQVCFSKSRLSSCAKKKYSYFTWFKLEQFYKQSFGSKDKLWFCLKIKTGYLFVFSSSHILKQPLVFIRIRYQVICWSKSQWINWFEYWFICRQLYH